MNLILNILIIYYIIKMDAKYILTKPQSDELYKMMKFIHDSFVKHKITYFICGGTLLGAIRHQGIIPHDDDGDICIFRKDVPKLRKLINYFDKYGYSLDEGLEDDEGNPASCTKSKDSCTWFIEGKHKNSLGCDVFIMDIDNRGVVNYADPYWKTADNGGKRCYFELEHVFPLIPYRYGNFYLYGPRNAILHLNTCYGDDWNHKGQTLYDHRTGKWTKGAKREMIMGDFLTLKPPSSTHDDKLSGVLCSTKNKECGVYRGKSSRKSSKRSSKKKSSKSSKKSSVKKSSKRKSKKSSRK